MGLKKIIDYMREHPSQRKFCRWIPPERVLGQDVAAGPFVEGKHYLEIELAEMFLRNRRVGTQEFVPLNIFVAEFLYGNQTCSLPVFIGHQLLRDIETYLGKEEIEFSNLPVLGPVPFVGGNVSLFTGLFKVQVDDLAKRFLNFLGQISGIFETTTPLKYLGLAESMLDGLSGLLGGKDVSPVLGRMQTLSPDISRPNALRKGYLVFVNQDEDALDFAHVWVEEGQLCRGSDPNALKRFKESDYCLLFIDQREKRKDYVTLPSHQLLEDARAILWEGNVEKARFKYLEALQAVRSSADLTSTDKNRLALDYQMNFLKEREVIEESQKDVFRGARTLHRGIAAVSLSARGRLKSAAKLTSKANFPASVEKALLDLTDHYEDVPGMAQREREFPLSEQVLNEQMTAIGQATDLRSLDPDELIDAILVTEFGQRN